MSGTYAGSPSVGPSNGVVSVGTCGDNWSEISAIDLMCFFALFIVNVLVLPLRHKALNQRLAKFHISWGGIYEIWVLWEERVDFFFFFVLDFFRH